MNLADAVENVHRVDGANLLGTIVINEIPFHVLFIAVHDVDGEQVAVDDPHDYFHDLAEFNDEAVATVKAPGGGSAGGWGLGLSGSAQHEYAVVIFPYAR